MPRCNNASAGALAGRSARSPSANRRDSADGEHVAYATMSYRRLCLDFVDDLKDLQKGPWEVMLPEAQAPKGAHSPSGHSPSSVQGCNPGYFSSENSTETKRQNYLKCIKSGSSIRSIFLRRFRACDRLRLMRSRAANQQLGLSRNCCFLRRVKLG